MTERTTEGADVAVGEFGVAHVGGIRRQSGPVIHVVAGSLLPQLSLAHPCSRFCRDISSVAWVPHAPDVVLAWVRGMIEMMHDEGWA